MTDGLVAFLRARYDEDEAVAQAAINHTGRWRWDHDTGDMCNDPECPYGELIDESGPGEKDDGTLLMRVHGYDVTEAWQGAIHIARQDPAHTLRRIEAQRQVVEASAAFCPAACSVEHTLSGSCDLRGMGPVQPGDSGPSTTPVSVLRLLALPYSDHPDYREEWRP